CAHQLAEQQKTAQQKAEQQKAAYQKALQEVARVTPSLIPLIRNVEDSPVERLDAIFKIAFDFDRMFKKV
ncbi:hypothetical protein A2U01_0060063, partial [Trifolium medium]|nr:hypothetical protein [Trifolium medium]